MNHAEGNAKAKALAQIDDVLERAAKLREESDRLRFPRPDDLSDEAQQEAIRWRRDHNAEIEGEASRIAELNTLMIGLIERNVLPAGSLATQAKEALFEIGVESIGTTETLMAMLTSLRAVIAKAPTYPMHKLPKGLAWDTEGGDRESAVAAVDSALTHWEDLEKKLAKERAEPSGADLLKMPKVGSEEFGIWKAKIEHAILKRPHDPSRIRINSLLLGAIELHVPKRSVISRYVRERVEQAKKPEWMELEDEGLTRILAPVLRAVRQLIDTA